MAGWKFINDVNLLLSDVIFQVPELYHITLQQYIISRDTTAAIAFIYICMYVFENTHEVCAQMIRLASVAIYSDHFFVAIK